MLRSTLLARLLAGALAALPALVAAQGLTQGQAVDQSAVPPPVVDPRAMSESQRRAYGNTLREARGFIDAKQYDAAIAALDPLIRAHPREPQARFLKGVAQSDAGHREEAVATFRALLADYPELPEPRNNLAVLYAQHGNYELAREELEIALQASPDYAVAHENLADVYARLAAVHYERTVELDKRNRTAPGKLKLVRDVTAAP
jgi:tetratricopeptide (TPR) repeat protein